MKRKGLKYIILFCFVMLLGGVLASINCAAFGSQAEGERLKRMISSPRWNTDRFQDVLPKKEMGFGSLLTFLWASIKSEAVRAPEDPMPYLKRNADEFQKAPASGLRITWLGHSTLILEIDGKRILMDPVWGKRISPMRFMGPKRFHPTPLPLVDLMKLKLDAILISHDHYDHLDMFTIRALKKSKVPFFVPLGVGAHLEGWGIQKERITELDWFERAKLGQITLTATPSRHFSGRGLSKGSRDKTLWSGWAVKGPRHNVYYSGDTAMFPGFKEIGEKLGPFDLTMIEVGAYNAMWSDVHLGPEQAVQAHQMVRGRVMLPVHWGTFDLALHAWTEPIERTLVAAERSSVRILTPRPGQSIEPSSPPALARWWPNINWQRAEDAPVRSTGLPPIDKSAGR